MLKPMEGTSNTKLKISEVEIPCYVLEDETRVITQTGLFNAFGLSRRGRVLDEGGAQLPRFMASKSLNPLIDKDLRGGLSNPIEFIGKGGKTYGYPAEYLHDICKIILRARRLNTLNRQQKVLAERAEILLEGFANVGIIALVDEATGYQKIRAKNALENILEQFISDDLKRWTKTFPCEFYEQIYRLRNWDWKNPDEVKRPRVIGKYTNNIVYERLAPGILEELKKINPADSDGRRKNKHHQWFTPDKGHPKLKEHLAGVIAIMKSSPSWEEFKKRLNTSFPIYPKTKTILSSRLRSTNKTEKEI